MNILNNYRTTNGKVPLLVDPDIQEAAEWMSEDMGVNEYFSHCDAYGNGGQVSPCPSPCAAPACRNPWTRMCDFGYCYNTYKGENIAAGYTTAQSVFNGWQSSPGHNSNMLGTNFRVMGIARVYVGGSPYGYYWTNDFGGYNPNPSPPPGPRWGSLPPPGP